MTLQCGIYDDVTPNYAFTLNYGVRCEEMLCSSCWLFIRWRSFKINWWRLGWWNGKWWREWSWPAAWMWNRRIKVSVLYKISQKGHHRTRTHGFKIQGFPLQIAFSPFDIHPSSKTLIINLYLKVKSAIILPRSSFSNDVIHIILSSLKGRDTRNLIRCSVAMEKCTFCIRCEAFAICPVSFVLFLFCWIYIFSGIFRLTSSYSLGDFREEIVRQLCDDERTVKPAPPSTSKFTTVHIPRFTDVQRRCVVCVKKNRGEFKVRSYCCAPQCEGKYMHVTTKNCFEEFHSEEYHS